MSEVYTLDGIPSDVLTGALGDRKLKIAGTISAQAAPDSALDSLSNKAFTHNVDGTINTIITTDKTTGLKTMKTFTYNPDGSFLDIDVTEVV